MATEDTTGLTSCFELISKLENELRTAQALRDELTQPASGLPSPSLVVRRYCRQLLDDAVEVVRATAAVQDEVCGLAANAIIGRRPPDMATQHR